MPKYSFTCNSCNKNFGVISKPSLLSEITCDFCSSEDIKRVYNFGGQVVERDIYETIDNVRNEAKQIAKKVKSGDQNTISEIYGKEK